MAGASVAFSMVPRPRVTDSQLQESRERSVDDLSLDELSAAVREVREAAAGMDFDEWTSAQRERVGRTLRRALAA